MRLPTKAGHQDTTAVSKHFKESYKLIEDTPAMGLTETRRNSPWEEPPKRAAVLNAWKMTRITACVR